MFTRKESYCLSHLKVSEGPTELLDVHPRLEKKNIFMGLFYVCLTAIFYEAVTVVVKKLPYINANQLLLIRSTGMFVGALPTVVYCEERLFAYEGSTFLPLLNGLLKATGLYLTSVAYGYLPLVEATVVMSTTPIVTKIMARTYLKEYCGVLQMTGLLLAVTGLLLSVHIPERIQDRYVVRIDPSYFGGLAAAMVSVLFTSTSIIITRKVNHVNFALMTLYTGISGIILNAVISAVLFPLVFAYCDFDQVLCVSLGLLGFLNESANTLAIQHQPAGLATLEIFAHDIIVIIVFQIIFFGEYPDVYSLTGGCLVIMALVFIGIEIWIVTKPEDSRIRKKFRIFLP